MNKKYIDFVPKNGKVTAASRVAVTKTATEVRVTAGQVRTVRTGNTVRTTGAVRSVSAARLAAPVKSAPKEVKAEEFEPSDIFEEYEKPKAGKKSFKPKFVKTEVEKRPLSKNVYQKKVVTPKEEKPSKPVTIIHKPEKDSKVGLIVTIIITIILGAAAGTVAFLLLPK